MSTTLDMEEVNEHLDEIMEMYKEDNYFHRLKKMMSGLKAPRQSRQYREAMIEVQRLAAPVTAILLPVFGVLVLMVVGGGTVVADRVIETQVMEAEEVKDLDKIEDLQKPEEQMEDVNMDIPINNPNVSVNADTPTPNQQVSPQPQAFDAVMTVKSPMILKNIYGSTRNTGTRGTQLAKFGGDRLTEDAVLRALRWLKTKQQPDGSWPAQKVAMTGLSILTYLAHGEKPGESAEFGPTIQKGLEFLLKSQRADGKFNGMDRNEYAHPIATYALCEAYGMTLNPNVKAAAEKALVPIIKGQHPTGGWTYKMDPGVNNSKDHGEVGKYRDDTSYMGWCAQALKAAKLAKLHADGIEKATKLAIKGFKRNANPNGGFGYTGPGTGGLTSVGTLCMQLLGAANESEVKKSLDIIETWTPTYSSYGVLADAVKAVRKDEIKEGQTALAVAKAKLAAQVAPEEKMFYSAVAQYYFYYATQCKFHQGGKHWDNWNKAMKSRYVKAQQIKRDAIKDDKGKDCDIGWWENADSFSDRPVMDTCLAALQLMVYYRYLPTTSKEAVQVEDELVATSMDNEDIKVDTGNL